MEILWELLATLLAVVKAIFFGVIHTIIAAPRKSVKNDIVLVTGGGSGIGQLMCLEFAKLGATIVSWDVNAEGNKKTASMVKGLGGNVFTYSCDVSKREDVRNVAAKVKADVGEVTILINNAGIVTGRKFLETPDDQLIRTMEINTHAHFWTVKEFLPTMVQRNHGHVVTIASIAGIIGVNGLADYCCSKFANVGFTESLALELVQQGADNVHTTVVCPHKINTGMFDGCEERFPLLTPELSPEYAAKRVVQAVLTNQRVLFMPRGMYLFGILKSILPADAALALYKFFGASNYMDKFIGRNKKV